MFAADQGRWSTQSSARSGPIVRFVWHHQAGTNDDGTIGAMVSGSRQVSATWTVDNGPPVGAGLRDYARITAVVPEDRRPWTTASSIDDGALTVECANSSGPDGDPPYSISDASFEACARLAAYAEAAYGIPLQRATAANGWRGHMGHKEAFGAPWYGYATACPMNLDIDRILDLASRGSLGGGALQPTTQPDRDEDDMQLIQGPTRGIALVGPGYFRQLVDDEEVALAGEMYGAPKFKDDRKFDVAAGLALGGRPDDTQVAAIQREDGRG